MSNNWRTSSVYPSLHDKVAIPTVQEVCWGGCASDLTNPSSGGTGKLRTGWIEHILRVFVEIRITKINKRKKKYTELISLGFSIGIAELLLIYNYYFGILLLIFNQCTLFSDLPKKVVKSEVAYPRWLA